VNRGISKKISEQFMIKLTLQTSAPSAVLFDGEPVGITLIFN